MSATRDGALVRLVDWAVGLVNPRAAVLRGHFRRMERDTDYRETVLAALRARGYRAAASPKGSTPWTSGSSRSADAEIGTDLPTLRARARELHRDDPIGSGIVDGFAREIVSTELRAQSRAGDEETARELEALWAARRPSLTPSDPVTFGQWQRVLAAKLLEDGEVFVKAAVATPGEPVWFETVEADRVSTPGDAKPADPQGEIRDGVERDRHGRVVAFWVARKHPGDVSLAARRDLKSDRVPADVMRHVKLVDRPGQTRGVTNLHAILQDVRDLDLLMLASLKRVQVAACLALFIKSSQSVPDLLPVTAESYGYQLDEGLTPGGIFKLYPGEEIQTVVPNFPVPELESFVIMLARRIGTALGVSWQTILRDWSASNYSSARTSLLADRLVFLVHRATLSEQVLDWVWRTVMEDAVLRGELGPVAAEDLAAVQWIADGWAWIDPLKEAQATQLQLSMRVKTLRDVCAEQGKDWEEQLRQALLEEKREADLRAELGLPPRSAGAAPPLPAADPNDPAAEAPPRSGRAAA